MNHLARVLEVIVDGARQGTVHLDINGKIKISKIKYDRVKENLFASVQTQMLDGNQSYGFGYNQYRRVLENCISQKLEGHKIEVKEKYLDPRMEELMVKLNKKRDSYQITNHNHK